MELLVEATERVIAQARVEQPGVMLATAVFGLGCNLYIMRVLHSGEHGHSCGHSHGHSHGHGHSHEHSHGHGHHHGHEEEH